MVVSIEVQGKKVLVAEDEPDIRGLIVFSLEFAGYKVIQAANGEDAIDKAEREQPDLILLDVRMPKMTGYEACQRLKARETTRHIPVVFLSALSQDAEIKYGLGLGGEEYIIKPFAPDELYRRVTVILERLSRQRAK
ncbi:MAG: response regulator [Anaerolineae bacterium]|nr:response regulator [Anaerolineae bacterium]